MFHKGSFLVCIVSIAIVVLGLFGQFPVAEANVIGIDFASDSIKVAIVQPGTPLEIVNNFQSKRKTPTCITFYRGERMFGSDSYALMGRKPDLTVSHIYRMLGRSVEHPIVQEFKEQYFPFKLYENETSHHTTLKMDTTHYTPEELMSMMLQHVKDMTQNFGGKSIKDCVITVPSSFTQHERQAVFAAASIADLKVLSLIEENTAAALHYGLDRTFEEPTNVMFFNMGAGSVQVTVVSYSNYTTKEMGKNKTVGQFEVVGKGWDASLGGFNFDVRLAELLADRFNAGWQKKKSYKAGSDVRAHTVPMTKLRIQANKVKEVLSANSEFPVRAEQLHADVDLNTKVTRQEFEEACEDLFARLTAPIDEALRQSGLQLSDLAAVELLGGGVRMPRVKKILDTYFSHAGADGLDGGGKSKVEVGQHLNGDEAMAMGAAFRAANISTAFRVRKVGANDISSFGVSVRLNSLLPVEEGKEQEEAEADAALVAAMTPLPVDAAADAEAAAPAKASGGGLFGGLFGGSKKDTAAAAADVDASAAEDSQIASSDSNAAADAPSVAATAATTTAAGPWSKFTSLYSARSALPSKTKTVAFQYHKDIACRIEYDESAPLPGGSDHLLAAYNITGIAAFASEHAEKRLGVPKVHLSFGLDSSGIVELLKAEATLELPVVPEPEPEPEVEAEEEVEVETDAAAGGDADSEVEENADVGAKDADGANSTATDMEDAEGSDSAAPVGDEDTDGDNNSTAEDSKKAKAAKSKAAKDKAAKAKASKAKAAKSAKAAKDKAAKAKAKAKADKYLRKTLKVKTDYDAPSPARWSPALVSEARSRMLALKEADDLRKDTEAALNDLEGYIYKVKNTIADQEEELAKVSTEEQRTKVVDAANAAEEWLYDEGRGQTIAVYAAKQQEIKDEAEAIFSRSQELELRTAAVKKAQKLLSTLMVKVDSWPEKMPQITQNETDRLLAMVKTVETWLEEKTALQEATSPYETPAFESKEVAVQLRPLSMLFEKLLNKPKPTPPKVKNNSTSTNSTINGTDVNATDTDAPTTTVGSNATETDSDADADAAVEVDTDASAAADSVKVEVETEAGDEEL